MTWNPNRPTNDEKIRDMGQTVFRPFWDALQTASDSADADEKLLQWGVNLIDRNAASVTGPNDPDRIETTTGEVAGVVYCKNDGTDNELFFMDSHDPANVIQLTEDGNMGSSNTTIVFKNFSFSGSDPFVIRWARYKWNTPTAGSFNKVDGSTEMPTLASVAQTGSNSTWNMTVTMSPGMGDANYALFGMINNPTGGNANVCHGTVSNSSTFVINFRTGGGGTLSPSDADEIYVQAIGAAPP